VRPMDNFWKNIFWGPENAFFWVQKFSKYKTT